MVTHSLIHFLILIGHISVKALTGFCMSDDTNKQGKECLSIWILNIYSVAAEMSAF